MGAMGAAVVFSLLLQRGLGLGFYSLRSSAGMVSFGELSARSRRGPRSEPRTGSTQGHHQVFNPEEIPFIFVIKSALVLFANKSNNWWQMAPGALCGQ